jgi:hypothetical protein
LVAVEEREVGRVAWAVYRTYVANAGWTAVPVLLLIQTTWQCLRIASDTWLERYTDGELPHIYVRWNVSNSSGVILKPELGLGTSCCSGVAKPLLDKRASIGVHLNIMDCGDSVISIWIAFRIGAETRGALAGW